MEAVCTCVYAAHLQLSININKRSWNTIKLCQKNEHWTQLAVNDVNAPRKMFSQNTGCAFRPAATILIGPRKVIENQKCSLTGGLEFKESTWEYYAANPLLSRAQRNRMRHVVLEWIINRPVDITRGTPRSIIVKYDCAKTSDKESAKR